MSTPNFAIYGIFSGSFTARAGCGENYIICKNEAAFGSSESLSGSRAIIS